MPRLKAHTARVALLLLATGLVVLPGVSGALLENSNGPALLPDESQSAKAARAVNYIAAETWCELSVAKGNDRKADRCARQSHHDLGTGLGRPQLPGMHI